MDDIIALVNAVKAAADVARGLKTLGETATAKGVPNDFSEALNTKIIDMQSLLMEAQLHTITAQEAQSALAKSEGELRARIAEFENWEIEKVRYELYNIGGDGEATGLVYRLREEYVRGPEPVHYICPTCYEDRRKSILQSPVMPKAGTRRFLVCSRCKTEVRVPYRR